MLPPKKHLLDFNDDLKTLHWKDRLTNISVKDEITTISVTKYTVVTLPLYLEIKFRLYMQISKDIC